MAFSLQLGGEWNNLKPVGQCAGKVLPVSLVLDSADAFVLKSLDLLRFFFKKNRRYCKFPQIKEILKNHL